LRSGNYPETTRYNYLLAAVQLARFLEDCSPDPDADEAVLDPAAVTRAHVEAFQAWMIETRSASTALNKHKGLQQFFKWLMLDEEEIERSPMERVRQPRTPQKLVPVMRDADTTRVLVACKGKSFLQVRDEAIIRLFCNTGARLSEVGNLQVEDIDLNTDSVHYHGKGSKDRRARFGLRVPIITSGQVRRRVRTRGGRRPVGHVDGCPAGRVGPVR
jgi:site-specific recombinase XerD